MGWLEDATLTPDAPAEARVRVTSTATGWGGSTSIESAIGWGAEGLAGGMLVGEYSASEAEAADNLAADTV